MGDVHIHNQTENSNSKQLSSLPKITLLHPTPPSPHSLSHSPPSSSTTPHSLPHSPFSLSSLTSLLTPLIILTLTLPHLTLHHSSGGYLDAGIHSPAASTGRLETVTIECIQRICVRLLVSLTFVSVTATDVHICSDQPIRWGHWLMCHAAGWQVHTQGVYFLFKNGSL